MTNGQWLVVVALAFVWGWLTADWRRDSLELAINSAAQVAGNKSQKAMLEIASESARALEDKLEVLESGRPKEIRTEILKPVFTNVCVSDDFIRMYNATVDNTERTLSGKPEAKMPNGKSSAH
ncbi:MULTISPECIES: hypothetical protein [Enterobacter]|uniref:hypothetical protein n=1 Tax=Enterobacter TaxID=547 RepID=UPI000D39E5D2|nr:MULTISPECIES: hypothetical protein [Enterobacter]MBE3299833.1 hypothetical protein [Enterobacter cloacae complex sp. P30U]DAN92761.1 MAG TPA: hypothetical protein [Caudoviricetes sp.]EKM5717983.1 hypothetical protein [Enterobacter cloacae]EKU2769246.1 hypothetical protein [Enterobacter cloacae]QWC68337.1 hypothetical protein JY395_06995 [Enterobacter mori]